MDRRGFLGTLTAITTAIATGVKLPAGREVAKAAPKAVETQGWLVEMLKDCHVRSIEGMATLDGPMRYVVEYVHAPGSKKQEHSLIVDTYTQGMRPVTVQYSVREYGHVYLTVEWA